MKTYALKSYLFFLFTIAFYSLSAQQPYNKLLGLVIDAQTKTSLPGATVYLDQTTKSTFTTDSGTFILNYPPGNYTLIVSYVGYKPYSLPLDKDNNTKLLVELIPDTKTLNEVSITADPNRAEYLSLFKGFFLGKNVRQCIIVNPNVLSFSYTRDTYILTAKASEPLIIENHVLGYRVHYDLISFMHYAGRTSYGGYSRYEELPPQDSKQEKQWESIREQSYKGSSHHFLRALANNKLKEDGFIVKKLVKRPKSPADYTIYQKWQGNEFKANDTVVTMSWNGISYSPTDTIAFAGDSLKTRTKKEYNVLYPGEVPQEEIISPSITADLFKLSFNHSLFITYNRKMTTDNFWGYGGISPLSYVTSIITMLVPQTTVDLYGNLENPNALIHEGYWATLRAADQLPFDYYPVTKKNKSSKK